MASIELLKSLSSLRFSLARETRLAA